MEKLYPSIQPLGSDLLDVGGGHRVYVEHCGNPDGIPVVFLHGGPGSGCKADHRQFFDPARYHVVLLDQRGSGRSTPYGATDANTTPDLCDDLERVREHYAIDRWMLFGGSWGAALALAYAQRHPRRVSAMVLRGSFLARRDDVGWFFGGGVNRLLPRQWQAFRDATGIDMAGDVVGQMHDALFGDDRGLVERFARAWEVWSGEVVMYSLNEVGAAAPGSLDAAVAKARIELHYAVNGYFLDEGQLLRDCGRLPQVPVRIIHGARDITCPAESAFELHQAIAGSELEILRTAGHLSSETPMIDALVRAADELARTLGG